MILTEYLLNTGRRPQTTEGPRKSPCNQVWKKIKTKTTTKELGHKVCPWERAGEEERFLHLEKPFTFRKVGWDRRGASEPQRRAEQPVGGSQGRENTARMVPCPALPSLTRVSARAGGGWMLGLGLQDQTWGKDWGWLCWGRLREWESCETVAGGYTKRKPGPPYRPVTIVWRAWGEWGKIVAFRPVPTEGRTLPLLAAQGDAKSGHRPPVSPS